MFFPTSVLMNARRRHRRKIKSYSKPRTTTNTYNHDDNDRNLTNIPTTNDVRQPDINYTSSTSSSPQPTPTKEQTTFEGPSYDNEGNIVTPYDNIRYDEINMKYYYKI